VDVVGAAQEGGTLVCYVDANACGRSIMSNLTHVEGLCGARRTLFSLVTPLCVCIILERGSLKVRKKK